ncbi:GTP cyclohydrolase-2 [Variibacter gotjawalensis]|uniref:GTP cyclohydrolase-2 n=1 Tax=Variibacter gotjawalensis TaxID=1333996 RepID=A0A0S3PZU6_9BRAD|nr:GTP cyclohydrolase II [Variibacter gotjawalensis]BAT61455.1 GTP cyclohydrolase-2 [Variibacter gotjawalensis]
MRFPLTWDAPTARERGPIVATVNSGAHRNAIGAHGGPYVLYRALAVSARALDPLRLPDLHNTAPVVPIGPFPQWSEPGRIVALDPWGHRVAEDFAGEIAEGIDIRPSIAVTRARLTIPEIASAISLGRLRADGHIVRDGCEIATTKIAIEPVWHLPGIAKRFDISERELRRTLFEETSGMYPELVTRPDMPVFLPPAGSTTVYMFGDVTKLGKSETRIALRVHDECNGSDVFGSDICTCRPYLTHGIEGAAAMAQQGGVGIIVYNRKEGRALGEVTKFLVYNARKRQEGGDQAATYFARTECVAGVQDARFQQMMPDVIHWLGIRRVDQHFSMSNMKHDALVASGIDVVERVPIPDDLIPADARVEMEAKKAAGYFAADGALDEASLAGIVGRSVDES